MFAGRYDELKSMEKALFQTVKGNPQNFLILGERGIGKSSLLYCIQKVADGVIDPYEGPRFHFLTMSIVLEPSTSYLDIVHKVGNELRRVVGERKPAAEFVKATWDFLKRWEVMGVKYAEREREPKPNELLDELVQAVEQTVVQFGAELQGVLILIDEADKPSSTANLGEFVKLFTERLMKRGCRKVCLGLAGLSILLENLRKSHESSIRIFDIHTLEPLLPNERIRVVDAGLADAKDENGFEVTITEEAKQAISDLSEGYPHFLQQFCYSAFDYDTDNEIDVRDVNAGALHPEMGAIQQLGLKYFHELYFDQIGSDEYREVLRAMAQHLDQWVEKSEIRKTLKIKESTLNNAIAALKKKHIILFKPGVSGTYRLPTKSFAVWIRAFTKAMEVSGGTNGTATPPASPRAITSALSLPAQAQRNPRILSDPVKRHSQISSLACDWNHDANWKRCWEAVATPSDRVT
jgi:hypothetical protein